MPDAKSNTHHAEAEQKRILCDDCHHVAESTYDEDKCARQYQFLRCPNCKKVLCQENHAWFKPTEAMYDPTTRLLTCPYCIKHKAPFMFPSTPRVFEQLSTRVFPHARRQKYTPAIASDGLRTIGLKSDGTITLSGRNPGAKYSQSDWQDIKQIAAANGAFVGVRGNGTVVLSGNLDKNARAFTQGWSRISAVCFDGDDVIGLDEDGKVLLQNTHMNATEGGKYGQDDRRKLWLSISSITAKDGLTIGITNGGSVEACTAGDLDKRFMQWKNIRAVAIGSRDNVVGLKEDGTLEISLCRCPVPKGQGWDNLKAVAAGPDFLLGLKENGAVVISGRNWDVSGWTKIVSIAAGKNYAVGLKQDGSHVLVGQYAKGQDLPGWKGGMPAPRAIEPFCPDEPEAHFLPMGQYPHYANDRSMPIEWQVLCLHKPKENEARALVISRYAIDCRAFHKNGASVDWEGSSIRQWLNDKFKCTFFSDEEQQAIAKPPKDDAVQDHIFLLSREEAEQYIKNHRTGQPTEYAESQGADVYGADEHCSWLLRSPGTQPNTITVVGPKGDFRNAPIMGAKYAIRPAMWINLNASVSTWLYQGIFDINECTYTGYYRLDQQQKKPHGCGKLTYKGNSNNGHTFKVYEGDFANGQLHGQGMMTWADGCSYDGDWQENKQTGEGKYTSPIDGTIDEGYFKDGELINGTRTLRNRTVIHYKDGLPVRRPSLFLRRK